MINLDSFKATVLATIATKYTPKLTGDPLLENDLSEKVINKVEEEIQGVLPTLNTLAPTQSAALMTLVGAAIHHTNVFAVSRLAADKAEAAKAEHDRLAAEEIARSKGVQMTTGGQAPTIPGGLASPPPGAPAKA